MSASQRAPVGDTVKSEERWWGGKVIQNKRAKNDVEPRVHWTLNTAHQFIIIDHLHQDTSFGALADITMTTSYRATTLKFSALSVRNFGAQ